MIGIGGHLQKNTKIKILGARAKDYNAEYERLEKEGHPPEQIPQMLATKAYEMRHSGDDFAPEPYKVDTRMEGLGGSVSMGFEEAHKTKSETKTMFMPAQTNFRATKQLKSKGMSVVDKKQLQEQKDVSSKMKNRICQDHLAQTVEGVDYGHKKESDYMANYVHNDNFQKEVDKVDMTFHQRKNDLKWYSEQYVKTKLSLRK